MTTHMIKEWGSEGIILHDAILRNAVEMFEDGRPNKGYYIASGTHAIAFVLLGKKYSAFQNKAHAQEICNLLKELRLFCRNNPNDGSIKPYVTSYGNEETDSFH